MSQDRKPPTSKTDSDTGASIVRNYLDYPAELVKKLAKNDARRAERAARRRQRLSNHLKQDDPQLMELRAQESAYRTRSERLQRSARRQARRPILKDDEWIVEGTIVDAKKQPVAGLQVRAFDLDKDREEPLGVDVSDDFGNFAIVFSNKVFASRSEHAPDIYVTVKDRAGKQFLTTRDEVRRDAGRQTRFALTLDENPPRRNANKHHP